MTSPRPHVRFLASVTDEKEAALAAAHCADIIDCKDPARGALGALGVATVRAIRTSVPREIPISATVGDLPCEPEHVACAVAAMAATGVDFVKVGLFPGGDAVGTIGAMGRISLGKVRLVGVLLADLGPDLALISDMRKAGFAGVMLDTAAKSGGSLLDHVSPRALSEFIERAHEAGMLAGLAGSLTLVDVPHLMALRPDVLGFRGALCAGGRRGARLDPTRLAAARTAIDRFDGLHEASQRGQTELSA